MGQWVSRSPGQRVGVNEHSPPASCVHVCAYVCRNECMYVHVRMRVCPYVCGCECECEFEFICVWMSACKMYECICIYMCDVCACA